MKPRLRLRFGVWSCTWSRTDYWTWSRQEFMDFSRRVHIGYGYTPQEAFRDWEKQQ